MQGSSRPNGLFSCIWSAFLRKKQLNQGAPRKKTPVAHGLADRRAFKQKAPRPVTGGAQFLAFSLSQLIKQPSRLRRPWRMLPDRRRRGRDRSAPYWARHLRHRLTLAYIASLRLAIPAHSWPCRPARIQTKTPHSQGAGRISRVFAKSAIKQPSRLRRPWRMLPDRRRPCPREPCGSSGCWPWKACK